MKLSYRTIKICYGSEDELKEKLSLVCGKILSIKNTTPDSTNDKHWISLYIEYYI